MSFEKALDIEKLPDFLTVSEVAGILRVNPLTVKRWGSKKTIEGGFYLPAIRINSRGDRRYKREVVLKLLEWREGQSLGTE